jgi:protein TonB
MQKALFSFLLLAVCSAGFAQSSSQPHTVLVTTKGDTLRNVDIDSAFTKVEVESDFPGGVQGWLRFLNANLVYPAKTIKKNVQGTVVLQFIVCTDGSVCNVEAVSGPPLLRQAAIDAIKQTPNWSPAFQNGKKVKSWKKQPIVFRLVD